METRLQNCLCKIFLQCVGLKGMTKLCTHLHPAPSTSTQLHLPPLSSIHLHPAHFSLRNWAIFLNLERKIQSYPPFWLKIRTHGILEVLISNPDLDFWHSEPKIHFWANLGRKCLFWLKVSIHSILRMLILIPTLLFSISNPKSTFGKIWAEKSKVLHFDWKLAHMVFRGCWFLCRH